MVLRRQAQRLTIGARGVPKGSPRYHWSCREAPDCVGAVPPLGLSPRPRAPSAQYAVGVPNGIESTDGQHSINNNINTKTGCFYYSLLTEKLIFTTQT